jgi:hypothetical protein
LEARTDYPVEFRCGSVTNRHRSKTCLVLEIGLLKDRVKRLEEAGESVRVAIMSRQDWNGTTVGDCLAAWTKAKEAKP